MGTIKLGITRNTAALLIVCLFVGIGAGTLFTNLMQEEIQPQMSYLNSIFLTPLSRQTEAGTELFGLVLRQRLLGAGIAWLVGLTSYSGWGFSLISLYYGFSSAVILSITTMQKGLLGLPVYIITLMPQWLFYLPVYLVFAYWAIEKEKKIRPFALLFLAAVTIAGCLTEVYINPALIRQCSQIF